ncbi:hypothetical protein CBR_g55004 [Chara braunii]|uniref:Dienelactone hydrolase domain-containing protein n=1 Tax=Chara braunii TaxID=69332 RepID=A0A388K7I9_CHABU|nr:hypothetical protein CBR_g55004 [Chara braunii]|eukprot:GBG66025.1 hypothetical protein CBR_g55004 [Chara braunii]
MARRLGCGAHCALLGEKMATAMAVTMAMVMPACFPLEGSAVTVKRVSFPGPDGVTLSAVQYEPDAFAANGMRYPAVVMMHGCSGMWSYRNVSAVNKDGTPNLQNHLEKWGLKFARLGVVTLAVDSFTPRGLLAPQEQYQCGGNSSVNPYTTRVQDARRAYEYLMGLSGSGSQQVDGSRVGLLGWSHGAQGTMVEAAATPREADTLRPVADRRFVAVVSFYPGCGTMLGFGETVQGSFWRPYGAMQLHVGSADEFYENCKLRAEIAQAYPYNADLAFPAYPAAPHSFDAFSQTWPVSKCDQEGNSVSTSTSASASGNADKQAQECAMRSADVDALDFFKSHLGLKDTAAIETETASASGYDKL